MSLHIAWPTLRRKDGAVCQVLFKQPGRTDCLTIREALVFANDDCSKLRCSPLGVRFPSPRGIRQSDLIFMLWNAVLRPDSHALAPRPNLEMTFPAVPRRTTTSEVRTMVALVRARLCAMRTQILQDNKDTHRDTVAT